MNFLDCYYVRTKNLIKESYDVDNNCITANISKEKFDNLLYCFMDRIDYPAVFILERPLSIDEERVAQEQYGESGFHSQEHYISGLSKNKLKEIFNKFLNVLKNDGLISFGFASQVSHDEIMFSKYNVAYIYSTNIEKYANMLESINIHKSDNFITAWDTFNEHNPGDAVSLNISNNDVYTFIDYATEKLGMYKGNIN